MIGALKHLVQKDTMCVTLEEERNLQGGTDLLVISLQDVINRQTFVFLLWSEGMQSNICVNLSDKNWAGGLGVAD